MPFVHDRATVKLSSTFCWFFYKKKKKTIQQHAKQTKFSGLKQRFCTRKLIVASILVLNVEQIFSSVMVSAYLKRCICSLHMFKSFPCHCRRVSTLNQIQLNIVSGIWVIYLNFYFEIYTLTHWSELTLKKYDNPALTCSLTHQKHAKADNGLKTDSCL